MRGWEQKHERRGAPFPQGCFLHVGYLGQSLHLASLSLPRYDAGPQALNGRRGELPLASAAPPPPGSSQSQAAVRGVCFGQSRGSGLGAGFPGRSPRRGTPQGTSEGRRVSWRRGWHGRAKAAPGPGSGRGGPTTGVTGAEASARASPGTASPGTLDPRTRRRSAASGAPGRESVQGGRSQASPAPGQRGGWTRRGGLGGACARFGVAGLETHWQPRGPTLGRRATPGLWDCQLLRVPGSALRQTRSLVQAAGGGTGGFTESWN